MVGDRPDRFFTQHAQIRFSNRRCAAGNRGPHLTVEGDKFVIYLPEFDIPDFVLHEELVHLQRAIERAGHGPQGVAAYAALVDNFEQIKQMLRTHGDNGLAQRAASQPTTRARLDEAIRFLQYEVDEKLLTLEAARVRYATRPTELAQIEQVFEDSRLIYQQQLDQLLAIRQLAGG